MKAAVPPIHRRLLLDVMFKLPVVECNFFYFQVYNRRGWQFANVFCFGCGY
jgi:hypothetical protein